jgi:protein-tyrosine phosphatase
MIDYHCHLLPGIDDGASDLAESLAMARLLAGAGFREVCCTPHCIRGSYDTTPAQVKDAVAALQASLDREGIALRLRPGMEYYLDEFFLRLGELQPLGDGRLLLVEAPGQANAGVVQAGLIKIISLGFTPLIAHPERTPLFNGADAEKPKTQNAKHKTPDFDLPPGCQFQANIGSFTGFYGARVQRSAYDQLRDGRYAVLGSDAHDARRLAGVLEAWQGKLLVNPVLQQLAGQFRASEPEAGAFNRLAWV